MTWFWILMLVFSLLIPLMMLGSGIYFSKRCPKEINALFGYRTTRSMQNKDTWEFANHYMGRLWKKLGWIVLVLSAIAISLVFGKDEDAVGAVGTAIIVVQTVLIIASIFPVESALKRTFDKDGNRKV